MHIAAHNCEPTVERLAMKNLRNKLVSKLTLIFYRESLSQLLTELQYSP